MGFQQIIKRYSGKKFFVFLASMGIMFFFWNEAATNPTMDKEFAVTVIWAVAIISAATSIGQGIHEHGQGKAKD